MAALAFPGWRFYLRLLRYARPYRGAVALQLGLMLLATGFGLLKPWPLKILVDNVAGGAPLALGPWRLAWGPAGLLALACGGYLAIHALESLVQFGSTMTSTSTCARMIRDLRADLLARLQLLPLGFHDDHRVGDLVHRLTYNASAVETAFQSGFMGTIKSSLTLVGMFVVMMALSPLLTVVALAVVPPLIVCIRWYARRVQTDSRRHQDQEGAAASRAQETLSAVRLVRAFQQESRELGDYRAACERGVQSRRRMTWTQGGFGLCIALTLALGTTLLFWVGLGQVRGGALTIGQFLVFNAYLAMLYAPLSVLSYTASSVQSALGGGARLFEILDAEADVLDRPGARRLARARGALAAEGVAFGYAPGRPVLQDLSFAVEPGEMVALVGETGGGKSTLLHLFLRFYDPWRGALSLDGSDLREATLASLRAQMSFLPQESPLFSGSIAENIAYGSPAATPEAIEAAAEGAAADAFIRELPEGYGTLVGERGVRLSVGQRQRLCLARALLRQTPVLLLDEPTSALDAETERHVLETLERLRGGRTILLAAHRLAAARRADRILVVARGEIVEAGRHEALIARGGPYARLWRAQAVEARPTPATEAPCASPK